MQLNKEENKLVLKEDETIIETYDLNKEITFENLMKYLLNLNFSAKIELDVSKENGFSEIDENLIVILREIIEKFNEKVNEFIEFKNNIDNS